MRFRRWRLCTVASFSVVFLTTALVATRGEKAHAQQTNPAAPKKKDKDSDFAQAAFAAGKAAWSYLSPRKTFRVEYRASGYWLVSTKNPNNAVLLPPPYEGQNMLDSALHISPDERFIACIDTMRYDAMALYLYHRVNGLNYQYDKEISNLGWHAWINRPKELEKAVIATEYSDIDRGDMAYEGSVHFLGWRQGSRLLRFELGEYGLYRNSKKGYFEKKYSAIWRGCYDTKAGRLVVCP